jgi:uncharacterized protein YbbC (DUF1343 family)
MDALVIQYSLWQIIKRIYQEQLTTTRESQNRILAHKQFQSDLKRSLSQESLVRNEATK